MGIAKKIDVWKTAGLITAKQANAIAAYETSHKGNRFVTGLIAVAVFAILCGVLSLVAANWMNIPDRAKLGIHLLMNAAVAIALYRADKDIYRDALCLLLFGMTLTLIILTGQIFQLGGNWANALMLWLAVTAPLVFVFGQTRITAVPWMLAFIVMIGAVINEYIPSSPDLWHFLLVTGFLLFLPLALIADGNLSVARTRRPAWARVFVAAGFIWLIIGVHIGSLFWYASVKHEVWDLMSGAGPGGNMAVLSLTLLTIAALASLAVYAYIRGGYQDSQSQRAAADIAMISVVFSMIPMIAPIAPGSIIAAPHIIVFWLIAGYIAHAQGWHRIVTLAIAAMAIRIFIAYCELFGDLMTTGYALIGGGVMTLALIWGAYRVNTYLKQERADAPA